MFSSTPHRQEDARHAGITYGMGGVSPPEMNQYMRAPQVSMSTDGFVRIGRLQAQVSNQQRHISELTARCDALVQEVGIQARAQRASSAEITLLRSQLQELQRWHVSQLQASTRGVAGSSSDGGARTSVGECNLATNSATLTCHSDWHEPRLAPSPGATASRFYPREIPEEDRAALRMRLMQDRGPSWRHTPRQPRKSPSPHPPVPDDRQPSSFDCERNSREESTPPPGARELCGVTISTLDAQEASGVALTMSTGGEQETTGVARTTSPLHERETKGIAPTTSPGAQEANSVGLTMSSLVAQEQSEIAGEDSDETEDECLDRHFGTGDEEDSDDESTQPARPTDSKQETRSHGDCPEPPPLEVGHVKTEVAASDLSPRTCPDLDRTCDTSPLPLGDLICSANARDVSGGTEGSVSGKPSGGSVSTLSSPKQEPVSNQVAEAEVAPAAPHARYTHQLFSSSSADLNEDVRHGETAMNPEGPRDSTEQRKTTKRGKGDTSSVDSEHLPRDDSGRGWDRYQHCTFCSLCQAFRTEPHAVAKCEACPRIVCRKCAKGKGEEVPRGLFADDVAFPADKCRCQSEDAEFPKPREGKDAQAHLLKHLARHDLSRMFREPVDVEDNPGYLGVIPREDMMDLQTIEIKLKKNKQYRSPRGQMLFRADLQKIWSNCWKYAAYRPDRNDTPAGIVRCTLILQAMIEKFYVDHMQRRETTTQESWPAGSHLRERQRSARCTRPAPNPQLWPSGTFAGLLDPVDDSEEETDADLEEDNSRIGATVGHKRRFVIDDDDDDTDDGIGSVSGSGKSSKAAAANGGSFPDATLSAREKNLNQNLCVLASIGKRLGRPRRQM
ncbi:unnamed protein product [Scytosiphon promiscuus]